MDTPIKQEVNRRRKLRQKNMYQCRNCQYTSSRYYNVNRHEYRIHTATTWKRRCCDTFFLTKGDWYLHCEEYHPTLRLANQTSRKKYKILTEVKMVKEDERSEVRSRPSKQRLERVTSTRYMLRPLEKSSKMKEYQYDWELSSDDSTSEKKSAVSRESSGYETRTSSLDINENDIGTISERDENCENELENLKGFVDDNEKENIPPPFPSENISYFDESNDWKNEQLYTVTREGSVDFVDEVLDIKTTLALNLPIKKRILQHLSKQNSRETMMHTSRKMRLEEDAYLSNNANEKYETALENNTKVQVHVDPGISWHEVTRVHREYFDSLLSNRAMYEIFCHMK